MAFAAQMEIKDGVGKTVARATINDDGTWRTSSFVPEPSGIYTAHYPGDENCNAGDSSAVEQVVNPEHRKQDVIITFSLTPNRSNPDQPVVGSGIISPVG